MKGPERPNILFILSDQYRADCLGFKGVHQHIQTPNLDRLAANGVSFDRAVSPAPICGPARCSMFTGLYPHQARGILQEENLGARDEMEVGVERDMMINTTSLREPPHLTRLLEGQGYNLGYAGKWHLGEDALGIWFPKHRGSRHGEYEEWLQQEGLPESGWPRKDTEVRTHRLPHMTNPRTKPSTVDAGQGNDAWITDIAIEFLREQPRDQPFFLVCGLNGPHPPFVVPEPFYSMYDPAAMHQPANFGPTQGEPLCKDQSFYRRVFEDHGEDWSPWQKSVAVYHGFCSYIDHQVGRLLTALDDQGVLNETVVVFASDHGEMLGQHGLWHKMQAYEEALRVPLIFSAPWLHAGVRSDALASLLDLPSTFLGLAHVDVPEVYEGEDLSGLLRGEREELERSYVFSEQEPLGPFHQEADWRMVADQQWKYVWNYGDIDELYDMVTDPYETVNLAGDPAHTDRKTELRGVLSRWMVRTGDKFSIDQGITAPSERNQDE
jgi:arylsulfatase A-like enzyme